MFIGYSGPLGTLGLEIGPRSFDASRLLQRRAPFHRDATFVASRHGVPAGNGGKGRIARPTGALGT
jgi:hypothetical protein